MAGWAAGASLPTVANERSSFYRRVLEQLLDQGVIRKDMSVLVVAGGAADRDAFHDLGFERVTISNVDEDVAAEELAPYEWSFQDAEALTYPDGSFDLAVVSAGLHHCRSPHRALLELYRVASVAALAIESRDSALMRVAVRLGAVDEYELAAVAAHGFRSGGVANTSTPNYVYRWSEREVEKTVASFAPMPATGSASSASSSCRRRSSRSTGAHAQRPTSCAAGRDRNHPRPSSAGEPVRVRDREARVPDDLQPWMRADGSDLRPDAEVVGRRYGSSAIGRDRHQQDWERLAEVDALWAVLTRPGRKGGRWDVDEFFATGEAEIAHVFSVAASLGRPARRGRAIDFGCGVGRLTRALGTRFESALGVDISAGMIDQRATAERRVPSLRVLRQHDARPRPVGGRVVRPRLLQHRATAHPERARDRAIRDRVPARRPSGRPGRLRAAVLHPSLWSFQPRRRIYALLRQLGVSERGCCVETPLTPMRMTTVPKQTSAG